jgi:Tfp pilus assembly protein PilF
MPVTLVSLATLAFCAYASFVHFVLDTPEYAWKQANKAIAEEDWDTAEIHLRSVVQKRPEYVSARMSLVHVYRQREQAGLDKLEIALRKRRGDLMIPAPAVEQLVEVARLVPGETHARQLLLKVWQAEGRHDAAAKTARELYDLGDREVMTVYHVANNELQKDNWDSAEKLVDELVGLVDPGRTYESLPIVQMLVRLHRGRGNVYRTQALLQSTLDRVQQMTSVELQNLPLSHVESVGFLLRASCQDALDQQSLIDRCSVSLDVFDRLTPVRSTDRYAFETAEEGAILAGTLVAAFKHPTLRMQEEPQWQELLKLRQKLLARFVEQVEQALPSKDLSIRGHLLVAKAAIELGSDKQGLAVLSHGLTTYETDESASQEQLLSLHMMAAEQLIKQGRFDDANTHLEKLIASPQSASSGHLLAGLAAVRQGNTVQAREHLKQITGESTETLTAQVLMCACYVADGSSAKLLSALDAVEAVWADLPQERQQWVDRMIGDGPRRSLQRAQALAQLGQHQDAIRLLATLENSSVHEPAIVLGALVLNKSGQTAVAKDLLRKARYADRQSLPLLLAQVQMAIDSGEYQSAAMALRIFVGQTPEDVTARLVLARLLTTHLELDNEALAVLDEVRRIRPDLKQAWYSTANILIRNSRTWDLKDLLAELRKQPQIKHLVPLIEARMALKKSGLDEAEAVLRKADADVKQMAEWQMTSAILALHNGDAERALQLYAGALDDEQLNDKARAGFLQTLARALNQGDPARTRQQIADLLKQRPEEPTLLVASIALAANDEDFQAASQSLEQLKKHGRDGLQVA